MTTKRDINLDSGTARENNYEDVRNRIKSKQTKIFGEEK